MATRRRGGAPAPPVERSERVSARSERVPTAFYPLPVEDARQGWERLPLSLALSTIPARGSAANLALDLS